MSLPYYYHYAINTLLFSLHYFHYWSLLAIITITSLIRLSFSLLFIIAHYFITIVIFRRHITIISLSLLIFTIIIIIAATPLVGYAAIIIVFLHYITFTPGFISSLSRIITIGFIIVITLIIISSLSGHYHFSCHYHIIVIIIIIIIISLLHYYLSINIITINYH